MSFKYVKPDGQVKVLDKKLSDDEILRNGYSVFINEKKKKCLNCKWWVNENPKKIGDFEHKFALNYNKGFCLMQDLFTYTDANKKNCENFLIFS